VTYKDDFLDYGLVNMSSDNLFSETPSLFTTGGTPIDDASVMIRHCGDRIETSPGNFVGAQKIQIWFYNDDSGGADDAEQSSGWVKIKEFTVRDILILTTFKFKKVTGNTHLEIDLYKATNTCRKDGISLIPGGKVVIENTPGEVLDKRVKSQFIYPAFYLDPKTRNVSGDDIRIHQLLGIKTFE
jgi:hypothetical protein